MIWDVQISENGYFVVSWYGVGGRKSLAFATVDELADFFEEQRGHYE